MSNLNVCVRVLRNDGEKKCFFGKEIKLNNEEMVLTYESIFDYNKMTFKLKEYVIESMEVAFGKDTLMVTLKKIATNEVSKESVYTISVREICEYYDDDGNRKIIGHRSYDFITQATSYDEAKENFENNCGEYTNYEYSHEDLEMLETYGSEIMEVRVDEI